MLHGIRRSFPYLFSHLPPVFSFYWTHQSTYIGKCLVVRLLSHEIASDPLAQFVEGRGPYLFRRGRETGCGKMKRHRRFSSSLNETITRYRKERRCYASSLLFSLSL